MTTDIKTMTRGDLLGWLADHQVRAFRADQILKWVYLRMVDNFDQMTDLRKDFRLLLAENFIIQRPPIIKTQTAGDGTQKFLFGLEDGNTVESVLIPERNHYTLCVSSQVGCALGCHFCVTGKGGLVRNLSRAEIINQVWEIRKQLDDPAQLTNLVFMGMGEPLANYQALVSAIEA
ncbi:MAG: radical SAM protein, partial [Desulfobacteraceae bacterium]